MQWRSVWFASLFLVAGALLPAAVEAQSNASPESVTQKQAGAEAGQKNPFTGDEAAVAEGKKIYMKWGCYGCHGTQGGGGMGPNLIDAEWRYGGTDADVFKSVYDGRPNGMPPWTGKLTEEEIWKVIAYLRSQYTGDESAVVW